MGFIFLRTDDSYEQTDVIPQYPLRIILFGVMMTFTRQTSSSHSNHMPDNSTIRDAVTFRREKLSLTFGSVKFRGESLSFGICICNANKLFFFTNVYKSTA